MSDLPYNDEFDDEYRDLEFDPETGEYRSSLLSGGDGTDSLPGAAGGQTQTQAPSPMAPRVSAGGQTQTQAPSLMAPRVSAGGRAEAMLRQLMETGAQGRTMPSNAADLAMAQTRVASILSKALKGMDGTSGLERVGNAALQTLAGQGRVSFPQAMAAMEQQDLGRAYNIANALSGLAKAQGAGAMTPQQMLNYVQRVQESEDRNIRTFDSQLSNEVGAIARGAVNPGAVIAAFRNGLTSAGYDRAQTVEQKREIANKVLQSVANQPFAQPRPRRGEGGEKKADELPGFPMNADGTVNFFGTIAKPKSAEERMWNSFSPAERRIQYDRLREKYTTGGEGSGGISVDLPGGTSIQIGRKAADSEEKKAAADFATRMDGFKMASGVIDRMTGILRQRGGSAIGALGATTNVYNYLKDQVSQLYGGTLPTGLQGSVEAVAGRFNETMRTAGAGDTALAKILSADNSADATRMKTNLVFLTYYVAKILDDKGALSNNDVKTIMGIVGGASSANDMIVKLEEVKSLLAGRVKSAEDRLISMQKPPQAGRGGAPAPAPAPAPYPPPVPAPVPAPTPAPAPAPAPTLRPRSAAEDAGARNAISRGANPEDVRKRLRDNGIDPEGL